MIQIRFQSECESNELEALKSKIYLLDSDAHVGWFADLINYNVRVDISSKISNSNMEQIKCLCKETAFCNYIEVYKQTDNRTPSAMK